MKKRTRWSSWASLAKRALNLRIDLDVVERIFDAP
jgi:hypothetical protein